MRRALLTQLPALTRFYGLRPWDFDDMTFDEVAEYVNQHDEYQRERQRREART